MTKEEWVEFFEAVNGRIPTAQEFQEAKEKGEFSIHIESINKVNNLEEANSTVSNSTYTVCPKCNCKNENGSIFCPNCGTKMDGTGMINTASNIAGSIADRINSFTGGEGVVELKMRDLFSQVFKKHTREEAENIFACGSKTTTPLPENISKEWPKPWYFARVFLLLLVSSFMLYFIYVTWFNRIAFPGLMFVAALTGAMPVLFFYFECNSPRNIDIMTVFEIFFIGGILSLVITHVLTTIFPSGAGELVPSMMTGLIEELAKILATGYFISKFKYKRYIFNGLLIGGAVGAGFAVFETAGYIFNSSLLPFQMEDQLIYVFNMNPQNAVTNAILRGLLAFGGHVAWAAISGAGIRMVLKKQQEFTWSSIFTGESLRFLILVIILHGAWDTDIISTLFLQYIALGILAWIIIFIIINRALKEINDLSVENNPSVNLVENK